MSWFEFVMLWLGVFITMLVLGLAMVATMKRHPHDYSDDEAIPAYEYGYGSGYGVTFDREFETDDIDAYLAEQVNLHGGRVEMIPLGGYRHIWADGTRKVYQEA